MSERRRAVITGMGAVTPSGLSADELWQSVSTGQSAIDVLQGEEFASLPVRIGGQVRGFASGEVPTPTLARRLSPVQQWAYAAAVQARRQNGYTRGMPWVPPRFAVIGATGSGPVDQQQRATRLLDAKGPRAVPPTLAVHGAPDSVVALLSQHMQAAGTSYAISATCASGALALGEGMRRIRHGYADAVLVVGYEDCLGPVNLASNANLRSLAAGYEDEPQAASRPFDRARSGFVMSQGAAAILLEAEDVVRGRATEVLAVLEGFGESSDTFHPTLPQPDGAGAALAIRGALEDAGIAPDDIDHINAHGTGTPAGDVAELRAFERALGERARSIPLTATKSSTGHLLGAAGVVEAILAVQSIRTGLLPPTLNLTDPEEPGWDYVTSPRSARVDRVLSTSFGFGGHNGALVVARADEKK